MRTKKNENIYKFNNNNLIKMKSLLLIITILLFANFANSQSRINRQKQNKNKLKNVKISKSRKGIYYGLNFGSWYPDYNNKVLGNAIIFGGIAEMKFNKNSLGHYMNVINSSGTTKPFFVQIEDTLISCNGFILVYILDSIIHGK